VADYVEVFVQIRGADVLAGQLWAHRRRAAQSQTFSYSPGYLAAPGAYELDPRLELREGAQQTAVGRAIFGAFSDCAPDRWGRRLIARNETRRAADEHGAPRSLGEIDYLLGVRDDLRQGALRFRDPQAGVFVADERSGVPSLLTLPALLSAVERIERDEEDAADLALLLRQGSSLGGARPKAHVMDAAGRVAIAKFPSASADEWNVMLWERVALQLAADSGINVPSNELIDVDGRAVLLVERFDRVDGQRIGYVSALTMLERADGESSSYLEIADVIERASPAATADLHELWRRIAFSILISNFDDHLRNHGFLRTSTSGWTLSPAFDLNPDPRPGHRELRTAIDFSDHDARPELLMSVSGEFRLAPDAARAILAEVSAATATWSSIARALGAGNDEIADMRPAFEHEAAQQARALASV
jgi:serine/threonine-protein kinase HipA